MLLVDEGALEGGGNRNPKEAKLHAMQTYNLLATELHAVQTYNLLAATVP